MTERHDGKEVRQHQIKLTNTGDGLSQAVAVDPIELHMGDKGYAIVEWEKTADGYGGINGGTDLKRIHTLRAKGATIVDATLARPLIDAQVERIIKARDEATGNQQLPLGKPEKAKGATKKAGASNVTPIGGRARKGAAKKTAAKK